MTRSQGHRKEKENNEGSGEQEYKQRLHLLDRQVSSFSFYKKLIERIKGGYKKAFVTVKERQQKSTTHWI